MEKRCPQPGISTPATHLSQQHLFPVPAVKPSHHHLPLLYLTLTEETRVSSPPPQHYLSAFPRVTLSYI